MNKKLETILLKQFVKELAKRPQSQICRVNALKQFLLTTELITKDEANEMLASFIKDAERATKRGKFYASKNKNSSHKIYPYPKLFSNKYDCNCSGCGNLCPIGDLIFGYRGVGDQITSRWHILCLPKQWHKIVIQDIGVKAVAKKANLDLLDIWDINDII